MRVFRYEVPVDDRVHGHRLSGPVLGTQCRQRGVVEFWALAGVETERLHYFRVYGTGHEIDALPAGVWWRGMALDGPLVWHLFEGLLDELQRGAIR